MPWARQCCAGVRRGCVRGLPESFLRCCMPRFCCSAPSLLLFLSPPPAHKGGPPQRHGVGVLQRGLRALRARAVPRSARRGLCPRGPRRAARVCRRDKPGGAAGGEGAGPDAGRRGGDAGDGARARCLGRAARGVASVCPGSKGAVVGAARRGAGTRGCGAAATGYGGGGGRAAGPRRAAHITGGGRVWRAAAAHAHMPASCSHPPPASKRTPSPTQIGGRCARWPRA